MPSANLNHAFTASEELSSSNTEGYVRVIGIDCDSSHIRDRKYSIEI